MPHWLSLFSRCHRPSLTRYWLRFACSKTHTPSETLTTSRSIRSKKRLTLKARRIPNGGGSSARLRWVGRKNQYDDALKARIKLGVQWRRRMIERSPRKIRGISRIRYPQTEGNITRIDSSTSYETFSKITPKQPVRTKYVWLGGWAGSREKHNATQSQLAGSSRAFDFDSNWTTRFHRMAEKGENVNLYLSLRYTNVEQLVRKYAGLAVSVRTTHQAWMHIPSEQRLHIWQDVMLWCLHNSPTRAVKLLLASMRGQRFRPPRHVIGDCLQHVTKHFLHKVANPDPWAIDSIHQLLLKYVRGNHGTEYVQSVPDQVVFLILKHCHDKQVVSLLEAFAHENVQLHANTLLHGLTRALNMGNVNLSLRLLRLVSISGLGMHRDQVQSACVRLIRAQYDVPEPFSIQTKILTQILEMGVRPNIAFYNAVLLNTVEAGHFDLALQMFEIAKANKLTPDEITYRILLQGATVNADRPTRNRLVGEMEKNTDLLQNLCVVGDLLTAMSRLKDPAYPSMLALYQQHCNLRPLVDLGLCKNEDQASSDCAIPPKERWPSANILGLLMCAYIQMHKDSENLIDTYNRYHDLVRANHPIISPVAQTDHVANAFLMAFGLRVKTLPNCATVVKHMLDDSSSKRLSIQPPGSFLRAAAPTVRTWSILASAYFRHHQIRAAEKVLDLMRERGIEPDQVTWNKIVNGYSSTQNVSKAVDAVRRMQAAGFKPDERTFKGLSRVYSRERLLGALGQTLGTIVTKEDEISGSTQKRCGKDELQEMAQSWETDDLLRGSEVYGYLQERYRNLAAEQQGLDDSTVGAVGATL